MEGEQLVVDVHTTLRTPIVATRRGRAEYSSQELNAAVSDAAPYLASHLEVTQAGRALSTRLVSSAIDEPIASDIADADLETLHARTTIAYDLLPGDGPLELGFTSHVLEELELAPGQPWDETFAVLVSADASHTASGVLHTGKSIALSVPRTQSTKPGTWIAPRWTVDAVLAVLLVLGIAWAIRRRIRDR